MENLQQPAYPIIEYPTMGSVSPGFSKWERACIELGMPETGDSELDELIRKSERKRIAALAMQGLCACPTTEYALSQDVARLAISYADALLAELAKPVEL